MLSLWVRFVIAYQKSRYRQWRQRTSKHSPAKAEVDTATPITGAVKKATSEDRRSGPQAGAAAKMPPINRMTSIMIVAALLTGSFSTFA